MPKRYCTALQCKLCYFIYLLLLLMITAHWNGHNGEILRSSSLVAMSCQSCSVDSASVSRYSNQWDALSFFIGHYAVISVCGWWYQHLRLVMPVRDYVLLHWQPCRVRYPFSITRAYRNPHAREMLCSSQRERYLIVCWSSMITPNEIFNPGEILCWSSLDTMRWYLMIVDDNTVWGSSTPVRSFLVVIGNWFTFSVDDWW